MKGTTFSLLTLLTSLVLSCGGQSTVDTPSQSCRISGTINGVNATHLRLFGYLESNNYFVDSMEVNNGSFVIESDTLFPGGIYYIVFPNEVISIFLGDDQEFSMTGTSGSIMQSLKFEGSLDNDLFYENLRFEEDYQPRIEAINNQLQAAAEGSPERATLQKQQDDLLAERDAHLSKFFDKYPESIFSKFKNAGQNPQIREFKNPDGTPDDAKQVYYYRNEFWDNVDFTDSRLLRTPVIKNKVDRYINQLTAQNQDSMIVAVDALIQRSMVNKDMFKFIVNYIGTNYQEPKFMGSDGVYVHIVKNYITREQAFWAKETDVDALQRDADWRAPSLIGQQGQDFTAPDGKGGQLSFFDSQSPYLVLYIFNPDCENCQKESPLLVQAYNNQLRQKGVDIFTISDTDDGQIWMDYLQKSGLSAFRNTNDPTYSSQFHRKYHFKTTPGIYVLNPARKIIGKNINSSQILTIVERDMSNQN